MDYIAKALGLEELSDQKLKDIYSQLNYEHTEVGVSGFLGKTHTEEWKKKASERGKKRIWSEETKAKISKNKKGFVFTEEHRAKLSAAKKGRKLPEEVKAKISLNNRWNKKGEP